MRQRLDALPATCDTPSVVTRYDAMTMRLTFGCDDATGGIDYRIVSTEGAGTFDLPIIERRQLCLRSASGDACI